MVNKKNIVEQLEDALLSFSNNYFPAKGVVSTTQLHGKSKLEFTYSPPASSPDMRQTMKAITKKLGGFAFNLPPEDINIRMEDSGGSPALKVTAKLDQLDRLKSIISSADYDKRSEQYQDFVLGSISRSLGEGMKPEQLLSATLQVISTWQQKINYPLAGLDDNPVLQGYLDKGVATDPRITNYKMELNDGLKSLQRQQNVELALHLAVGCAETLEASISDARRSGKGVGQHWTKHTGLAIPTPPTDKLIGKG